MLRRLRRTTKWLGLTPAHKCDCNDRAGIACWEHFRKHWLEIAVHPEVYHRGFHNFPYWLQVRVKAILADKELPFTNNMAAYGNDEGNIRVLYGHGDSIDAFTILAPIQPITSIREGK